MDSITDELDALGIEHCGGLEKDSAYDEEDFFSYEKIPDYEFEDVGAVVTGIDFTVNYSKLCLTSIYI